MTAVAEFALEAGTHLSGNEWKAKHDEWCRRYNRLYNIAQRIADSRRDRARKLCAEAGLDPNLLGIHPHNALVSAYYGEPWAGVDYVKVRECQRLLDCQFAGFEIVRRWDARVR